MDCKKIRPMLSAFHDNELSPADRASAEAHLQGCPACARVLEALARVDAAAGVPDPGPDYWESFNRRLDDRIARQAAGPGKVVSHPRRGWARRQFRYLIPAAAAAALVVSIVRFGGMGPYSTVSPEPRRVEEKAEPGTGRLNGAPTAKGPETARMPEATAPPRPAPAGRPEALRSPLPAMKKESHAAGPEHEAAAQAAGAKAEPERKATGGQPPASAPAYGEKGLSDEPGTAAEAPPRVLDTLSAPAGVAKLEAREADSSASSCDDARTLAEMGSFREAEAAQRACLAKDTSPRAQETGLVFLAELLDRQARFDEADAVLEEIGNRFPQSRALDLYRQQRPQAQSGEIPFPESPR